MRTFNCSLLLIYLLRKDERLSRPGWLTYSRRFTHISGHPSAAGRAQDRRKFAGQRPTFYHSTTQLVYTSNVSQIWLSLSEGDACVMCIPLPLIIKHARTTKGAEPFRKPCPSVSPFVDDDSKQYSNKHDDDHNAKCYDPHAALFTAVNCWLIRSRCNAQTLLTLDAFFTM